MEQIIDCIAQPKRITPANEQWFYGYYDNPAYSMDDRRHLAHHVSFWDRIPVPADVAELGIIDLDTNSFTPLTTTKAWNFQQGSMFQWVGDKNQVFHNIALENGEYRGRIFDLDSKEEKLLDAPLANLSRCGTRGLAVNLDRLFDFRPGYGYCQKKDPFFDEKHSSEDGIQIVDVASGKARMVLTMQQIWEELAAAYAPDDVKININHITFNPSADRFVFLARNFQADGHGWKTTVYISDLDGNLSPPLTFGTMASHYWWTDDETVMFWSDGPQGNQLYLFDATTAKATLVDTDYFVFDGHCSTHGEWCLYDSYPRSGYRYLYLYNLRQKQGVTLGGFRDDPISKGDFRTDLHPRWNRAGTALSFDGTFEGFRGIYTMDLKPVMDSHFA